MARKTSPLCVFGVGLVQYNLSLFLFARKWGVSGKVWSGAGFSQAASRGRQLRYVAFSPKNSADIVLADGTLTTTLEGREKESVAVFAPRTTGLPKSARVFECSHLGKSHNLRAEIELTLVRGTGAARAPNAADGQGGGLAAPPSFSPDVFCKTEFDEFPISRRPLRADSGGSARPRTKPPGLGCAIGES